MPGASSGMQMMISFAPASPTACVRTFVPSSVLPDSCRVNFSNAISALGNGVLLCPLKCKLQLDVQRYAVLYCTIATVHLRFPFFPPTNLLPQCYVPRAHTSSPPPFEGSSRPTRVFGCEAALLACQVSFPLTSPSTNRRSGLASPCPSFPSPLTCATQRHMPWGLIFVRPQNVVPLPG